MAARSGRRSRGGMPVKSATAATRSVGTWSHIEIAEGEMFRRAANADLRPLSPFRYSSNFSIQRNLSHAEFSVKLDFSVGLHRIGGRFAR